MICALTTRRIAPGKSDEFIEAFASGMPDMPEEIRDKFKAVYACKDVAEADVVLTFGLFDGTLEEFRELQAGDERSNQIEDIDPIVDDILFDRSFEVAREFVSEFAHAHS